MGSIIGIFLAPPLIKKKKKDNNNTDRNDPLNHNVGFCYGPLETVVVVELVKKRR